MTQYAKVKDDSSLKRDLNNGSLVADPHELNAYRARKAKLLKERDKEREFRELKNDVNDLKDLLKQLLEKFN